MTRTIEWIDAEERTPAYDMVDHNVIMVTQSGAIWNFLFGRFDLERIEDNGCWKFGSERIKYWLPEVDVLGGLPGIETDSFWKYMRAEQEDNG